MNKLHNPNNGNRRARYWFRRGHRWVGTTVVVFVLFLAASGVTLNHAADLGLDRRYVAWPWLLDAYGITSPQPSASFAYGEYRGTLVGGRLFVNGNDTGQRLPVLTGFVTVGPLILATGEQRVQVFTTDGDPVEAIDLKAGLPGPIERTGRTGDRAVLQSGGRLFRSDTDIAIFEPWESMLADDVHWSVATPPSATERAALDAAWRGHGLTVERVLLDLHSGRLLAVPGVLLMDIVALCIIVLGVSGLILARSRYRRENGAKPANRD